MVKENLTRKLLIVSMLHLCACGAVDSSELASSSAEDLKLDVTAQEYNSTDEVFINAQLKTARSNTPIDLDQGDDLLASSGSLAANLNWLQLEDETFLNFDHSYTKWVEKVSGNEQYHVKYVDAEGNESVVSFNTGFVSNLTSPARNTHLGNSVEVTWDPDAGEMNGRLFVKAHYVGDEVSGILTQSIDENSGSFNFDLSDAEGSGSIYLEHLITYDEDDIAGFHDLNVKMYNISESVGVYFAQPHPNVNRSVSKAAVLSTEDAENIVNKKLEQCLHQCVEGESSIFTVADEEYSCCLENAALKENK